MAYSQEEVDLFKKIWDFVTEHPGCTTNEMAAAFGLPHYKVVNKVKMFTFRGQLVASGAPYGLFIPSPETIPLDKFYEERKAKARRKHLTDLPVDGVIPEEPPCPIPGF